MTLWLGNTRLRAHGLMLLLPLLAAALGLRTELAVLGISLGLHEAAHLLTARALGVRVAQLRLMPFGGAAELENIYALAPGRLLAIAAAGPAVNAALVFAAAALCQWGVLSPALAMLALRLNLTLMLFNLLPALPLDGGRMLYALLAGALGRNRAVSLGIVTGRIVAVGLVALLIRGWLVTGRCNLSLAACALFIATSAPEERRALAQTRVTSPLNALKSYDRPLNLRLCAVSAELGALRALRHTARGEAMLYAVYRDGRLSALADERALLSAVLEDVEATVGDCVGFNISP